MACETIRTFLYVFKNVFDVFIKIQKCIHYIFSAVCYHRRSVADGAYFLAHSANSCRLYWSTKLRKTSGYATWFTAGGAIRIGHYDVIDNVITQKL